MLIDDLGTPPVRTGSKMGQFSLEKRRLRGILLICINII